MTRESAMAREIAEAPDAVGRLLDRERRQLQEIGRTLRSLDPPVVVTCARGSSDHAAGFFKYGLEILLGTPVASVGPSVASIYDAPLRLEGSVLLSISQSGQSPDIVALQAAARRAGAFTLAVVNQENSPLAREADVVVPLHAGPEMSVAATKSFITSTVAVAAIIASWCEDPDLLAALDSLPERLHAACAQDWRSAITSLASAESLFVLGRGPSYPVAQETALKFKETMSLHAEAFSAAEVMHGPLSLVRSGFRVFAFNPPDASQDEVCAVVERLRAAGAEVFVAGGARAAEGCLPMTTTGHMLTDPVSACISSYRLIEELARRRGFDPDNPSNLKKVTETL